MLWIFVVCCFAAYKKGVKISTYSSCVVFIALMWHSIGAHYSFPNVPFGNWLRYYLALQRNPYDRIGHFIFGLLALPLYDAVNSKLNLSQNLKIIWKWLFTFTLLGIGALYEIWEWLVIEITEHSTGLTFVGAQGDTWDAQKDMLAVLLGAILSIMYADKFIERNSYTNDIKLSLF